MPLRRALVPCVVCAVALGAPSAAGAPATAGPGDAPASWRLSYSIPPRWSSDREGADRMQVAAVLVPEGHTFRDADAVITISFQEKRPGVPVPNTLEEFFMSEMSQLLRLFPDLESEGWRPPGFKHVRFEYAGLEIFDVPRPLRIVLIDAGDGFYSVNASVSRREDLDRDDLRMFFDSLLMLPKRSRF